ncbi:lipopolysaccharide transport periplasmic protein LptA [Teredinibacter turnerae]|uniref:lipopolysaccharide transport periplasmic protein LptA n=1 Tax=Teredinibacter turnerae TaxID=2426 RepID=UPI0003630D95|nr:lipopolysaccharide transport periplasmic protein LptA [Teredinibacter turnerae]
MKPLSTFCAVLPGRALLCAAMLACTAMPADALPDDRLQDLSISADSAELDDLNGTTTYAGSVIVEQGSMKIRAEKVVIYGRKDTYSRVVATGTPARLSQVPKPGQEPVTARANRMEYQITSETLILLDNAAFRQEGTSLSGNRIEYDVKKAVVRAGGKADAEGDDRRVRMVIPPKALSKEDEQPADNNKSSNRP